MVEQIDRSYRPEKTLFSPGASDYLGIQKKQDWRKQSYDWIQPMASNGNMRHHFRDDFAQWIATNITPEYHHANSGIMFFDEPQLPHTDVTRDFVLLYNMDPGGNDAELCFWREKQNALYRERMLAVDRGPRLELVDRVKGPFNCWYIVNTRIIHSVENVTGMRLNVQVSFDTHIPALFYKRYLGEAGLTQGTVNEKAN